MPDSTKKEDTETEADGEENGDTTTPVVANVRRNSSTSENLEDVVGEDLGEDLPDSDDVAKNKKVIKNGSPESELEIAQAAVLDRQYAQIERLTVEVRKLKAFISKRKQTYKRKRKDEGAPTRALSAYNIFVQDRFSKLAKDNEAALQSDDTNVQLRRVPPASLVASTGNEWKELPAEDKTRYEQL